MDSSNIYSHCIASWNVPCGQGKHGEKDICKIIWLLHILQHLHLVIKRMNCSYQTQQLQMKYAVTVSIYVKSLDDIGELIKKYSCVDGITYDIENAIQSVKIM